MTPYNLRFKKSYGGTPEPQTPQDAPWLRAPSLKITPMGEGNCQGKVIVYVEIQRSSSEGFVELPVNQILVSKKAIHGSTL